MDYKSRINEKLSNVPARIVDFNIERVRGRVPTQAASNFLTNREQGDWAEDLVLRAINALSRNYIAIQYGKSENTVAGEEGFSEFYEKYQDELDTIGKRPDLLIFHKDDYDDSWGLNISNLSREELDEIVPKAKAGIEVRSSSFLVDKYNIEMQGRTRIHTEKIFAIRDNILENYSDLLSQAYLDILNDININTINTINFRAFSRSSSERFIEVTNLFRALKKSINEVKKRDFLSITPKVEDIKVVHKWINTYNVPHYYFQVFFDKVYGLSYENIIDIISNDENEGKKFFIERDTKNQNKTTIKINSDEGEEIAYQVDMPNHISKLKELPRGRLLFHVSFEGGTAHLNVGKLFELLDINEDN